MVERDVYMREGFDPNSLKVAQLRGILVEHEIPFSSVARKAELVDLFNSQVLPKTASLRKKDASIVASSSGIIDMRDRRSDTEVTPEQTPAKRKPGRPSKSEAPMPSRTPAKSSTTPIPAAKATRTPARKKSSLANQLATAADSDAEPEEEELKQEQIIVEIPAKRRRGRPRKSASASVAAAVEASEPEDDTRSARRVSFGRTESPPPSTSRKAKRLSYGGKSDEDGTFSDSNPFQSGSEASPAPGVAATVAASARKARRKATDGTTTLRKKTSSQSLKSDSPPKKSTKQQQSSSPSVISILRNYMDQAVAAGTPRIVGRLTGTTSADSAGGHAADDEATARRGKDVSTDVGAEADEEDFDLDAFTSPSALAKMRILRRQKDKQQRREQRGSKSLAGYLANSSYMLAIIGVLSWLVWYARETRALGFCDINSDTNAIVEDRRLTALAFAQASNETIEDTTILPARFQPICTPCPAHAECAHGKVLGCSSHDWVLQPNLRSHIPLARFFLPLSTTAPRCYPDTQKLVLASELAQAISHMLSEFKGEIICGTQKTHATVRALPKKVVLENGNLAYAIAEEAVKRSMSATRDARVDEDYFEQIWYMALFELTDPRNNIVRIPISSSPVTSNGEEQVDTSYYLAAKEPALSLSCRSRLALKGWVLRARLYFFLLLSAIFGFLYLRHRLSASRAENAKVALLVSAALERLQEQEYQHAVDPVLYPDDFVPLSHLRDHILSEEHNGKTRNRLWKKVAKVVEENSNVRTRQAQKKGEWLRVWQWVGVEGYKGTPSRRESRLVGSGSGLPVA